MALSVEVEVTTKNCDRTIAAQTLQRQKDGRLRVHDVDLSIPDWLKLLYWDGPGFCLYYKVLERGRFPWPNTEAGIARLTSAQLAMRQAAQSGGYR